MPSQEFGDFLKNIVAVRPGTTPVFYNFSDAAHRDVAAHLVESGEIRYVTDDYVEQLRELYAVNNPSLVYAPGFADSFTAFLEDLTKTQPLHEHGLWVHFPWRGQLVHILQEDDYFKVRTARNQNLITKEEQLKFYNATIGIAGLSVGSAVAFAIVLQGGAKRLRLADMDRLALTNTNRVLAGADRLGELKVEAAARTIYELNPYAQIELYPDGVTPNNIQTFFEGLDVVIDEIDELSVKALIREEAKKRRLPVVMAADNGDNAVVDIDRYDQDPELEYFHGRMGKVDHNTLSQLDKFGVGKKITELVGAENVTQRMQSSLLEMGKTIVSWPQLGGAALINGAAVAYCVRKILTGEALENNRALISLDEKLIPEYLSEADTRKRLEASKLFAKQFGIDL
jgi:tRNA A37 threonylcarbamoyladenosine dehydratase